eukprot:2875448-Pleurochrysis_carterae.AAC.2
MSAPVRHHRRILTSLSQNHHPGTENAGHPAPASLLAKVIAAKVEEDRVAGLAAKSAPPPEPAATEAAVDTSSKAVKGNADLKGTKGPEPEAKEAPVATPAPSADKTADTFYLLADFPRNAEDCAALAPFGIGLDSAVSVKMTRAELSSLKARSFTLCAVASSCCASSGQSAYASISACSSKINLTVCLGRSFCWPLLASVDKYSFGQFAMFCSHEDCHSTC